MAAKAKQQAPVTAGAGVPVATRISGALAAYGSARAWRFVLALLVAVLTYWTTAGGLITLLPGAQVALVVGVSAALVAPEWWLAAIAAGVACLLGIVTGPANMWFTGLPSLLPAALVGWAAFSAGVGAGVWWLLSRRYLKGQWVLWAIVALLIANLCWTVVDADRQPGFDQATGTAIPPLPDTLDRGVITSDFGPDARFYILVYQKVRSGMDFYRADSETFPEIDPTIEGPSGVLNVRFPTLYVVAGSLPSAWWLVAAYLLLSAVSACCVTMLLNGVVRAPLAIPGVAGVLTYAVLHGTSAQILFAEVWAGMLAVVAFAIFAASLRSSRWKILTVAAALAAFAAFAVRELAGFVLLAGFIASLTGRSQEALSQRTYRAGVWLAAGAAAAAFWAMHWFLARGYLTGQAGQSVLGQGSLRFLAAGLTYSTLPFSALALALAVLGLVGIGLLPRRELVVFGAIAVWLHLALYLYVGNELENNAGVLVNYWSATVLFTVYACVPAVLSIIPGASARTQAAAGRSAG